jgi:hypothetical protein
VIHVVRVVRVVHVVSVLRVVVVRVRLIGGGVVGLGHGDHVHDGALHVADLDAGGDLKDHVVAVHVDHRGVHAGRRPYPGTGLDRFLLLGRLLLSALLRPDHEQVERHDDDQDEDQALRVEARRFGRGGCCEFSNPHDRGILPVDCALAGWPVTS